MIQADAELIISLNEARTTDKKAEILREIRCRATSEKSRLSFVACELPAHCSNLLQLLKDFLQFPQDPLIQLASGCLWMLSRSTECQPLMMDPQLGLAPLMLRAYQDSNSSYSENIFLAICNCSLHPAVHKYLLSDDAGYLAHFHKLLVEVSFDVSPYKFFSTLVTDLKESNFDNLIGYDIVNLIVRRFLLSNNDPNRWENRFDGIEDHCLSFITSISTLRKGSRHLSQYPEIIGFLASMLVEDNMEGLRPIIILANVFGDNRAYERLINLRKNSHLLYLLNLIFEHYKNPSDNDLCELLSDDYGFASGMLTVRDLTTAVSNLSQSKDNASQLGELLMMHITFLFSRIIDNSQSIATFDAVAFHEVGGGGDDEESLIALLKCFIRMASHSDDDIIRTVLEEENELDKFLNYIDTLINSEEAGRQRWKNYPIIVLLARALREIVE
eukprot:gene6927-7474_t